MANQALHIFIVEDSIVMRNAIEKHLLKDFENRVRVYQFGSVEEAILSDAVVPDVMLLDHHLQSSKGIDAIPSILEKFDKLKIAVISGQNDLDVFTTAYSNGASEYIRKDPLFFHQISDFIKGAFN